MPETLYYAGSTTKSFVAASVLKLIEESANDSTPLTLKTKISSLIRDEFVLPDDYATTHVTLEDALSHRTGMPRHDYSYGEENQTIETLARRLRYLPMTAEIREKWQYCNMMFGTMSYVIETLTGGWVGTFIYEKIWKPLGMQATFLSLAEAKQAALTGGAPLSKGYFWNYASEKFVELPWLDSPVNAGAGATISNVLDYAKYLRAMLQMNTTILTEASYKELRTSRSISSAGDGDNEPWAGPELYGLGWEIANYRGHEVFQHGGMVPGYGSLMAYLPTVGNGIGIVAMSNGEVRCIPVFMALAFGIIDDILNTPQDERVDFVAKFDKDYKKEADKLDPEKARKRIFPDLPEGDALPLPLPIDKYAGSYWNDGYLNLTIYVDDPPNAKTKNLRIDALNKTWQHTITFEHVSGNYFLAWLHMVGREAIPGNFLNDARAAEFHIDSDGKVDKVGIAYEPSMGGEKIWFTRESLS